MAKVTITSVKIETLIENVFYCNECQTTVALEADAALCPKCKSKMDNIGWFEHGADCE